MAPCMTCERSLLFQQESRFVRFLVTGLKRKTPAHFCLISNCRILVRWQNGYVMMKPLDTHEPRHLFLLPNCSRQKWPSKRSDKYRKVTACFYFAAGAEDRITCKLSLRSLQYLVKEATVKNEWKKLRFLYLGSATSKAARGVCFECDASCVPLDLLIESNVEDLHNLVPLLLRRGALPNGLKECKRPPLLVAMEMRKFPIAVILLRNQADPSCIVGHGIFINKEVRKVKGNILMLFQICNMRKVKRTNN